MKKIKRTIMKYVQLQKFKLALWSLRKAGYNVRPGMLKNSIMLQIVPQDYANQPKRRR